MEIDEEAQGLIGQPQIGDELGQMEIIDGSDGLEFEDDVALDEQVNALGWELVSFVLANEAYLLLIADTRSIELGAQRRLIHRFEQPDTEFPVHFNCAADHLMAELIQCLWEFNTAHFLPHLQLCALCVNFASFAFSLLLLTPPPWRWVGWG